MMECYINCLVLMTIYYSPIIINVMNYAIRVVFFLIAGGLQF